MDAFPQNAVIFSPDMERADYRRIQQLMKQQNRGTDFIINQSTLRVEKVLDPNKNSYNFDLYETGSESDRAQERKLNRNDLFMVTHVALNIVKQDTTNGKYGNYPLFTFPDPNYFIGINAGGDTEAEALEMIYNGELNIKTSTVERLPKFLTNNLRFAPEAQTNLPGDTNELLAATVPQYGPTHAERGYFRLNPNLILDGQENNEIRVDLGTGNKAVIAGGIDEANEALDTTNVLVLLLHGFMVNNGAQKVGRWTAY
jgi:hypothetical protein